MNKLKMLASQQAKPFLHENVVDILFQNKNEISRRLSDIRGLYHIDHIAINIINPLNEVMIFSITPSVEYNLFAHELWRYDQSFSPLSFNDQALFCWDEGYDRRYFNDLKNLKEKKHHFNLGLNLVRKIEQFQIVYSFATRSQNENLLPYYQDQASRLFLLGDYGYRLIRDIYQKYCDTYIPPIIGNDIFTATKTAPHLRLIVNNDLHIEKTQEDLQFS